MIASLDIYVCQTAANSVVGKMMIVDQKNYARTTIAKIHALVTLALADQMLCVQ